MAQACKYPQFSGGDQVTIINCNCVYPCFKSLLLQVPPILQRLWEYGKSAENGGVYTVASIMRHPSTKDVVYFIHDDQHTKGFLIRQDGLQKIERGKRK